MIPMRIAGHRGNRLHAPENTRLSLVSAYTGGAGVLQFSLQLTKDGHLVVSHDAATDRLAGRGGPIIDQTLSQIAKLDFSATFQPRLSPNFRYFNVASRLLAMETFPDILDLLPEDVELLIELKHESSKATGRRDEFVRKAVSVILQYGLEGRTVIYSKDGENLKLARQLAPTLRVSAFDYDLASGDQLKLLIESNADGLVTDVDSVFDGHRLTPFGKELQLVFTERRLRVGAILYPSRSPAVFTKAEWETLRDLPFVWSLSTDSLFDTDFSRREILMTDEQFIGEEVNRSKYSFGYAKANKYARVYQSNGVHIEIAPYPAFSCLPNDALEKRLNAIETKLTYIAKDWPYYSGGGVGVVFGIRGDFAAEVDYSVEQVTQATTLEMAVVNVDPGTHLNHPPASFRDKDSFFDPHGAPPFVGVEHDEDDGYRINWNLGSEYDNNQYGRPVGDGKSPRAGRLRLERRGAYFSAYYRNAVDARDWVCCGIAHNESLNPTVYLRCVGKRWRQEDPKEPDEYLPIVSNHFIFKNLRITRFAR